MPAWNQNAAYQANEQINNSSNARMGSVGDMYTNRVEQQCFLEQQSTAQVAQHLALQACYNIWCWVTHH